MSSEQRDTSDERLLRIDCGTAETAELIRQIDAHGQLGVIRASGGENRETVSRRVRGHSPRGGSWVEVQPPPGEPLNQLIERLGSRPPAVLLDAWSHQLHQLRERLQSARLPLHRAGIEDLRVDGAARLHVANLPLRIAESVCRAEPQCPHVGSLAPWLEGDHPIDLSGFDALEAVLQDLSGPASEAPRPSTPVPSATPAVRAAVTTAPAAPVAPVAPAVRPPRRLGWLWFAVPALGATLAVVAFWNSGSEQPTPREPLGELPGVSAAAATTAGSSTDGARDSPVRQPASPPLELGRVLPTAPASELAGRAPLEDVDLFGGPAVDLAALGLEAPAPAVIPSRSTGIAGNPPAESPSGALSPADGRAPVETASADGSTAAQAPAGTAVDLPPRDDLGPQELAPLSGVAEDELAAAELELPPGNHGWRWALARANDAGAASSASQSIYFVGQDPSGTTHGVALLQSSADTTARAGESTGWSWVWRPEAAAAPLAEHLRNARLRIGSRAVYLRIPTEVPGVQLTLDGPQQTEQWALAAAPAPRASHLTLAAETLETGETAEAEPLQIRWLQPIEQAPDRSVRGIAEIRTAEDSSVAVRVRFDMEAGRSVRMETLAVATIAPVSPWHPISQPEVAAALDRIHTRQQELDQQLRVLEQHYARVDDRERKSLLRAQRRGLEEQLEVWEVQAARMGELQVLIARIAAEIQWRIELQTEWPDQSQRLFAAGGGV